MIRPVRAWVVLVMVLLLPLRGLVGEAMAGQMLQAAAAAASQEAHGSARAHSHPLSGHAAHDCDHHATADAEAAPAADAKAPADCPTCASCQVCSSVAVTPFVHTPAGERLSQAPPQAPQLAYPSAEPALAFKPPRG